MAAKLLKYTLLTLVLLLASPKVLNAAEASTFTIAPFSFELFANPGESITEKIKVTNKSAVENTYTLVIEDFKASGEDGSIDLLDQQSNSSYSLAKWITPEPKNFKLKPGAEAEISFSVNVPNNAEPGGHYASILAAVGGDDKIEGGSGASVMTRVGSLVLLRVSGAVKEDASLESFTTDKKYYEKGPVNFELRVKNSGNNHIRPTGSIVITNLFGQKVTEIPLEGSNVLPDAIRKMSTEWSFSKTLANRYTATLVGSYGQDGKPLSGSVSFIVMPRSVAITVGVLVLLFLGLVLGRKKVKKLIHNMTK